MVPKNVTLASLDFQFFLTCLELAALCMLCVGPWALYLNSLNMQEKFLLKNISKS